MTINQLFNTITKKKLIRTQIKHKFDTYTYTENKASGQIVPQKSSELDCHMSKNPPTHTLSHTYSDTLSEKGTVK